MIPRIIHFTVPRLLSPTQERSIQRARELHPAWDVKVWQDPVATDGFLLSGYHQKAKSGAQLADLIRLDVVHRHGGIYLDSDLDLEKSLEPLTALDNFFCSEDGIDLTNAAFGAEAGHPLVASLIKELLENEPDWSLPPNRTTGPALFSRVLQWLKGLNVLARDTFYPYNWNEIPVDPLPTSYGVHAWEGSWIEKKGEVPRQARSFINRKSPGRGLKSYLKGTIKRLLSRFERRIAKAVVAEWEAGRGAYARGADLVARTNRGILMSLPGSDLSITPWIALEGRYEDPEVAFVESALKGGDVFVDVGCNVGIFTLVGARRVGAFGRVYAIDANGAVLEHLKRSLVMNWVHDRTVVMHNAIGAEARDVELQFHDELLGGSNVGIGRGSTVHRSVELLGQFQRTTVRQVRLDDIFPFAQEIKVLKIDVEGFEHEVLAGAKRLVTERCFCYILLELLAEVSAERYRLNLDAVSTLIASGYRVATIRAGGAVQRVADLPAALALSRSILLVRE